MDGQSPIPGVVFFSNQLNFFAAAICAGMAARGEFNPDFAWELAKRFMAAKPADAPLYPPLTDDTKGATP